MVVIHGVEPETAISDLLVESRQKIEKVVVLGSKLYCSMLLDATEQLGAAVRDE